MLTLVEFVDALHKLSRLQGDMVVRHITVPLVKFAYLCSEAYHGVKQLFQHCVTLVPVFHMLDLVRVHDNLLTSVSCEKKACAAFAAWNNLAVLSYLYNVGFSWDEETLFYAVTKWHLVHVHVPVHVPVPVASKRVEPASASPVLSAPPEAVAVRAVPVRPPRARAVPGRAGAVPGREARVVTSTVSSADDALPLMI